MTPRYRALVLIGIDLVLPIGLYYVLRAGGVTERAALLITSLIPGTSVVIDLVRRRRPDPLSLFMTAILLGSAIISLTIHDTRFLLAKDGWFTALAGLWFLLSLRGERPLAFTFTRLILEGRIGPNRESWDTLWDRYPGFRRVWRVSSIIWGIALFLDAAIRVTMSYTLPIDVVPGLGGLQYGIFMLLMQVVMAFYLVPAGLYNRHSSLYRSDSDSVGTACGAA